MTCNTCEQETPCMCKANAALALRKALQQAFDAGLVKDMCGGSYKAVMAVEKTRHMVLVWENNYLAGEDMESDEPDQDEAVEGQPIEITEEPAPGGPPPGDNSGYFKVQDDLNAIDFGG